MRILLPILLVISCATSSGCASIGGALVECLVDATCNAIFDDDDCGCDIDPHILERKGIEPGSREHKKICGQEKMQREFYERNNL